MKNILKKSMLLALALMGLAAPLQAIYFGFGFGPRRYGWYGPGFGVGFGFGPRWGGWYGGPRYYSRWYGRPYGYGYGWPRYYHRSWRW